MKITFAGVVPLIGGMMFGAEKATGSKPEYLLSYPAFYGNDHLLTDYWPDVPYHNLDPETNTISVDLPKVDFVAALCPCAGLSQLNNGKKRGADAPQNDWMYKSTEYILEFAQPKVLWGENAPGLYGPVGVPVVERLRAIGEKFGYSMSLLKTSSLLHGVPQNRIRSFYFFWKSETAPILNWKKKDHTPLPEYLAQIKDNLDPDDVERKTADLQNDPLFMWLKKEYGTGWRDLIQKYKKSMMDVVILTGRVHELIEWTKENHPGAEKRFEHAAFKRAKGMGFWDFSPFVPTDATGALTGARMNAIHPTEERLITQKELMHMMCLPIDMYVGERDIAKIFQNVPSTTVADWTGEVIKFIEGKLEFSDKSFIKQDNINQRMDAVTEKSSVPLF